jgi:hypothetical protein
MCSFKLFNQNVCTVNVHEMYLNLILDLALIANTGIHETTAETVKASMI